MMKEKKFRLNWVDGLIVLVVIGLVAGTWLKFRTVEATGGGSRNQTPITYQVLLGSVRQYTVDAIRTGDLLYDEETGREVGTIKGIDVQPAVYLVQDTEGVVHRAEHENRYDLYLTVEAQGTVSGGVYTINRVYTINVGSFRQFYTQYTTWQGRIWAILE